MYNPVSAMAELLAKEPVDPAFRRAFEDDTKARRRLESLVAEFVDAIKARDWETADYLADKATEETGHKAEVFDREDV